ncbi:hypothetical protein UA08_07242 [Talaromyces atroroseus]|uniref:Major facilitator superfamily (MFS) profile domain-containing protein n=1 Tax=Talaromyces atroroseus TaxID=1441469 RepID=A0A225AB72_TALAT|nr:hypothetical protein UA08_07242 [Talaromyces atroroseus]OKL57510.1 hypothetical protein UA08_07242 [Talaromyces atroroseus]
MGVQGKEADDSDPSVWSRSSLDRSSEKKARTKVDFSVLPLLYLGFFVFQLDRMNIASAITDGFATDIHVTQSTINLGNQILFAGIVAFEIPCNMAQQRVGPRKWLAGQIFVFGLLATMQVFVRNRGSFLALKMLLGVAEAGYIPGAIYTLSTWYRKEELATRVAVFFFGMFSGNALNPLIASGILQLDGCRGLKGWQWLFLIEGLFTISVFFLFLLFLPGSPAVPRPLLSSGLVKFSDSDKEILTARLNNPDEGNPEDNRGARISLQIVWKTVSNYRRWLHFVSSFAVFSTWSPLTTYTPSIIMSLGFDRTDANALAAVGALLALAVVFGFAYLSDRVKLRGAIIVMAQLCYLITLIVALTVQPHVNRWSRWGLWTAVNSFAVGYHPLHNTWVQVNCRDPRERSISIALWVMFSNSGLVAGAQYFQATDKPLYENGLRVMIAMVSVGMLAALAQIGIYFVHNRRVSQGKHRPRDKSAPFMHVFVEASFNTATVGDI